MREPISIRPDAIPLLVPPPPEPAPPSLARSGLTMAIGTVASRGTGFLRTIVIAYAIGEAGVANSYAVANTVPNALYDLLLGGILSAVIVPLLVQAAHDDEDGGEAYEQRLVTMVIVALTLVAVLAVLLAPLIIAAYAHSSPPAQRTLAVTFARFFLPQLLFYGIGATFGAILNVRGSFAAPMWAPVLNNVVVIASGVTFAVITHTAPHPGDLSHAQILVLAIGTTAGVIAQTIALLPALRRIGFVFKARWDWRGVGLRRAGPFAGWVLGYVVTNQLGYLVVVALSESVGKGRGKGVYAIYSYAYIVFSLPYAVVAVTVITALFPGMSRRGAEGDDAAVSHSLAQGLSLAGVVLVPATLLLVALGPQIAVVLFQHGRTTAGEAHLTGQALAAFGIGLLPFSAFQMQLRAWLAVRDSRTPMLINVVATAINLALDVVLYLTLSTEHKVIGLALGYSLSYLMGTVIFTIKLRRRLVATRRTFVIRTHVRLILAALIAAIPIELITHLISHTAQAKPAGAFATIIAASAVGITVYVLIALRLRVRELQQFRQLLPGR
ncbi:MAG TPA: murein biosynthesis integral membrane protein MurJ [Mycobacteriales bacterium]|jgi:putative peptidoglycan lipid II flippase|nr:murein biosynthesis integral membrane protein MurJ [Mycobacteriales bacterium]